MALEGAPVIQIRRRRATKGRAAVSRWSTLIRAGLFGTFDAQEHVDKQFADGSGILPRELF
jgi:hypothetical protein